MPSARYKGLSRNRARRAYARGHEKGKKLPHISGLPPIPFRNAVLQELFQRGFRNGQRDALKPGYHAPIDPRPNPNDARNDRYPQRRP